MTWINRISPRGIHGVRPAADPRSKALTSVVRVDAETEKKLADFLVTHGRLAVRTGRPMLHFLGTCANHDGTHDYAVRTRVREQDGKHVTYDSTIRKYENGRLRLVR